MSEFDKKISALTSGSDSQAADEYVIARGGANYKITGANIAAAATKLGTIATGVWQGTAIANAYIATGLDVTKLTVGATLPSNVLASSLTSVGTLSSLTVSGDLTVDTSTLKVDSTNNRVGIGTATPAYLLDLTNASDSGERGVRIQNDSVQLFVGVEGSSGNRFIGSAINNAFFGTTGADGLELATNNTVRAILDASGNLAVDTNTLYVDAANNRVGIGTASPSVTFDVGAGTGNPFVRLNGGSVSGTGGGYFIARAGTEIGGIYSGSWATSGSGPINSVFVGTATAEALLFGTNYTERMRLDASGNLGIGVTPTYRMQVYSDNSTAYSSSDFDSARNLLLQNANTSTNANIGIQFVVGGNSEAAITAVRTASGEASLAFGTRGGGARTTRMTLDASGNLGIGFTSPTTPIDVKSGSVDGVSIRIRENAGGNALIQMTDNPVTTARLALSWTNSTTTANLSTTGSLTFSTAGTERARITSGGYFKASNAGTYISSTGTYHEFDQDAAGSPALRVYASSATYADYVMYLEGARAAGNNYYFLRCVNNADRLLIQDDGDVTNSNGTYGTISDAKLKQDIIDAPSQWDDLKSVKFRKYRMKADVATNPDAPYMLGVVAQELEQVSPGLVHEHPDYEEQEVTDENGNVTTEKVQVGTTKSVKSSILLMKAAVALQEAMARIEALEVEVAALKAGA